MGYAKDIRLAQPALGAPINGYYEHASMIDRVEALIRRLAPAAICDHCIADRLNLTALHQVTHRTRDLAGSANFECAAGPCSLCDTSTTAIRYIGRKRLGLRA